ncbi:Serine/threonine-protein phosphatase 2A regulatory subunit B'' subunit beta, partial [Geodia barretti]
HPFSPSSSLHSFLSLSLLSLSLPFPPSAPHRDKTVPAGKLSYKDFIWFLLSEEDKTTQRSIEYWFRCLDVDGDGVLSLYELQLFYEEVLQRLRELSIECLSVENTVCQVLDMVNPRLKNCISLGDLKACKLTPAFLNTFINVEKYLEFEQRDPVTMARDDVETLCSEWDRYAADQYEILLAEEAGENDTR